MPPPQHPITIIVSVRAGGFRRLLATCLFALVFMHPVVGLFADDFRLPNQMDSERAAGPFGLDLGSHETVLGEGQVPCAASDPQTQRAEAYTREYVSVGDFPHSILIPGSNTSVKIGGYAKFDFIQDFNSIGQTDFFDTTTIPTSGPQKWNTRLHARQTRLNLDVRHPTELGEAQGFVEGDFFGSGNAFRLRHGYGKLGPLLAGQTWSTFMDETIVPDVVDFENPTGTLLSRNAMLRWTQPLDVIEGLEYSLSVEDPSPAFTSATGTFENALPNFIGRLRYQHESMHAQLAGFATRASFEPTVGADSVATAWGVNLTGSLKVLESDKVMGQIAYGDGIERFRGFQSYTLDADGSLVAVPALAMYAGYEHAWTHHLKSVLAYSRAIVDQPLGAAPTALTSTDYLAANLLWTPVERVRLGVEYLHGVREDENASRGDANRLQLAVWYYLP